VKINQEMEKNEKLVCSKKERIKTLKLKLKRELDFLPKAKKEKKKERTKIYYCCIPTFWKFVPHSKFIS